jgi:hypothetical protein
MNPMQRYILVLGWIVLVGIVLCPPWDEGESKSRERLKEAYFTNPRPGQKYGDLAEREIPGTDYDKLHPQHFDRFKFLFVPPSYKPFVGEAWARAVVDSQILILELSLLGTIVGGGLLLAKGRPNLAPSDGLQVCTTLLGIGTFIFWCFLAFGEHPSKW